MSVFSANYVKLWFLSLISVSFRVFKWVALKRNLFPVHKIYTIVVLRNLVKRRPNCVNLSGRKILPGVGNTWCSFWPGLHFPLGEVSRGDAPTQRLRPVFLVQLKLKKNKKQMSSSTIPNSDHWAKGRLCIVNCGKAKFWRIFVSVLDPGCLSQIRIFPSRIWIQG